MRRKWDFFIAHAGGDTRIAETLYELLFPHSKVFLDSKSLILGDNWNQELPNAQRQSLITIVIISPRTENAYYEKEEIAAAIQMARSDKSKHRVIPLFLFGYKESDIPYGLMSKHSLVLSNETEIYTAAEKLLDALQKIRKIRRAEKKHIHDKADNSPVKVLETLGEVKEVLNAQLSILDQARITPQDCDKIAGKLANIGVSLRQLLRNNPSKSISNYFVMLYKLDEKIIELIDLSHQFRNISTQTDVEAEKVRQYIVLGITNIIKDIDSLAFQIRT